MKLKSGRFAMFFFFYEASRGTFRHIFQCQNNKKDKIKTTQQQKFVIHQALKIYKFKNGIQNSLFLGHEEEMLSLRHEGGGHGNVRDEVKGGQEALQRAKKVLR